MATSWTVGCDAADPQTLAAFWAAALGDVLEPGFDGPDNASIIDPGGHAPAIGFLRVPEGKTAKNRVHLDVRVTEGRAPGEHEQLIRTEVGRLVDLGATAVREERYDDGPGDVLGHVVMSDPEGNEFCVA